MSLPYDVVNLPGDTAFMGFITDLHLSARPPGRRVDNYQKAIMDKILATKIWLEAQGESRGASPLCLCGGDVFHIKAPMSSANPNALITDTMDLFKSFPQGGVWGVVGNHDLTDDNFKSLPNQPLGVLIAGEAYKPITRTLFKCGKVSVEVWGFSYEEDMTTLKAILEASEVPRVGDWRIGIGHAMARQGGAQTHFGHPIIGYDLLEGIDFDVMLWGHDHSYIPPTEVGNCLHIHPGSLSRAALPSDEDEREVMAIGLHLGEDLVITKKPLPTTPLEAAFRVADRDVVNAGKSEDVKSYAEKITTLTIEVAEDPQKVVEELAQGDKPLLDLVNDCCEW